MHACVHRNVHVHVCTQSNMYCHVASSLNKSHAKESPTRSPWPTRSMIGWCQKKVASMHKSIYIYIYIFVFNIL